MYLSQQGASASKAHPDRQFKALRTTLNLVLTLSVVGLLVACARELPDAMKRDQQMRFDQALNRCEHGLTAYCQQVVNGGNYAH